MHCKSQDRYIANDIDKDHCKVQKFTKSHLLSRKYDLKLTEIYPVSSDITLSNPVAFQKDDSSDQSEERDSELLTDLDNEQAQSVEIDHNNYPQPSITLSSTQTSLLHDVDPTVNYDSVEPDVDMGIIKIRMFIISRNKNPTGVVLCISPINQDGCIRRLYFREYEK